MPRMARIVMPDLPHHVTQRGNRREDVFFDDADRRRYLLLLLACSRVHALEFRAWCLMTNPVHVVAVPREPHALAATLSTERKHGYRPQVSQIALGACLALVVAAVCGCVPPAGTEGAFAQIYYEGTEEYQAKVSGFSLGPEEARQRAAEYRRAQKGLAEGERVRVGRHDIILGDCYVFSWNMEKDAVGLDGCYVNGHTGEVTWRVGQGHAPPRGKR